MTDTSIKQIFDANGYYVARGVFSSAEVRELEEDFDQIVSQLQDSGETINARWGGEQMRKIGGEDTVVVHTHNVQLFSARWMRAIMQEKFLDVAAAILGPDIILHHTKLFQKPPEKGAPFPMHQDWNYFPTLKDTMMAGVIHVSRATDDMGCFRVYPGSHKQGRAAESWGQNESEFLNRYPLDGATPLTAEPGDVAFFHYFTLHGSKPNRSSEARKTVLVQMYAGNDRLEDGHASESLVLRGWNHQMTRGSADYGVRKRVPAAIERNGASPTADTSTFSPIL